MPSSDQIIEVSNPDDDKIDTKTIVSTRMVSLSPSSNADDENGDEHEDNAERQKNPFADPKIAAYYASVYEKSQYECRSAFDPNLEWTPQEEKRVVRKIDWRICTWACIMFFALQTDRSNIYQAVSDNMLDDLGLSTDDYNHGITIFQVCFLLAEVPSQLISKKLGPDRWIPAQMIMWSVVAMGQSALSGRASFYVGRALLGILEGGFIPDIVLWLSYFYTSRELPMRLSIFWTSTNLTGIATSLLAFAIFHLDGIHGWEGWRWLFFLEGLVTLLIGLASIFLMPASVVQTKAWYRPNGWFTDREIGIVVNRILRDDPSKGDMNNRQSITPRRIWDSLCDYDLWPLYALALLVYIPTSPPSYYLTLALRETGFSSFNTNLLTIPNAVIGIFTMIGISWLSERVNERSLVSMIQALWSLPFLILLRFWRGALVEPWPTFALMTILLSYPYVQGILVAWTSRNSGSVRTRSMSAALFNMCVQLGNIISSNIYLSSDAPLYHKGNRNLIIINILVILLFLFTKWYYMMRNRKRQLKWDSMTREERDIYRATTNDKGNKRLDFQFAH
ncbi:putative pantothenate transporter [Xylogone sp. PMI_703]|nr:putative pantothenate transporter [Xylogone sp. PMI_703]